MATKTISLELDAYEKLKRAKRSDRESFSSVVRRARFAHETKTAEQVLSALREFAASHPEGLLDEAVLDRLSERAGSRTSRARPG
jgi:predicted CopG family antitoxin